MIVLGLSNKLPREYVSLPHVHLERDAGYEVRVYDIDRGRRLVAAVEIVSPAK